MLEKLQIVKQRFDEVSDLIIQPDIITNQKRYVQLNKEYSGIVFLLWGKPAQARGAGINKSKHCVMINVHPSPLSAHRGFFGCQHFSKANAYLEKNGRDPITWQV